jgi:hypothetical protein
MNIEPAQSRPLGPGSASPETAAQKVQQLQEFYRERAKARVRQRLGERYQEMTPAERLRARHRARQLGERVQDMRSGYGYVDRERARARVRQRLENAR